jgi:hypothetical protein
MSRIVPHQPVPALFVDTLAGSRWNLAVEKDYPARGESSAAAARRVRPRGPRGPRGPRERRVLLRYSRNE